MPDIYHPEANQPLMVFFDLTLGNLQRIFVSPECPIDFEFKIAPNPEVTFTLFDVTGFEVEPEIFNARDEATGIPGGSFSFGYLNGGKKSQSWSFQLEDVKTFFKGNSFAITFTGTTLLAPMVSTNQNSGTVQEILEKFCKDHNLQLIVNPEFGKSYMQDTGYNDDRSTEKREMMHHKWVNESDMAYIARILQWARVAIATT